MGIDCVEESESISENWSSDCFRSYIQIQRWNGRDVEVQTWKAQERSLISHFHPKVHQNVPCEIQQRIYTILHLLEEEIGQGDILPAELSIVIGFLHSTSQNFTLADATLKPIEMTQCKHFWKRVGKGIEQGCKKVEKAAKKTYKVTKKALKDTGKFIAKVGEVVGDAGKSVGKAVEKSTNKTVHFVKEHKTEVFIGLAIVAAAAGLYYLSATAASAAANEGANNGPRRRREDESDTPDATSPSGNNIDNGIATSQTDSSWITSKSSFSNLHSDAFMASQGNQFTTSSYDPNSLRAFIPAQQADATKAFQTAFNDILAALALQQPSTSMSQLAVAAPFQNLPAFREAFGQDGNLSQSGLAVFLESVGKSAMNILPDTTLPSSFLESLGLSDAYAKFVNSFSDTIDKADDNLSAFFGSLQQIGEDLSRSFNLDLIRQAIQPLDYSSPKSHLINQIQKAPIRSCRIETEGVKRVDKLVLFINGMNTSYEEFKHHLEYIRAHAGDISIQGIFNHSNGIGGDLIEIFSLSYAGFAPVTADLLIEAWTEFHNNNKDNPDAKCLQITHSMGNILVETALRKAPPEIRDRVIIHAFGPAKVVPNGMCHKAFHYASKNDKVHDGEDFYNLTISAFSNDDEPGRIELLEQLEKNKKQVILLDPHPDATGMDHDVESPTFIDTLSNELQKYLGE